MTRSGLGIVVLSAGLLAVSVPFAGEGQRLRGSRASMDEQNRQADLHDFTRIRTPAEVDRFVKLGLLVRLHGNRDYRLHNVSYPYARPAVKLFVERLSGQYRSACGEELVVTSLTRPSTRQPRNSSERSVHPAGMAVDFRRSNSPACRRWIERVLLGLEAEGVLEATRERNPPHYHVAVYPNEYEPYAERRQAAEAARARMAQAAPTVKRYQVRNGDTLWKIARAHDTTVARLRSANNIRGSRIYPGEVLEVPISSGLPR